MNVEQLVTGLDPCLTEASVFERVRRIEGLGFNAHVAHASLIFEPAGRDVLERIHRDYLDIARRHGLPTILLTDTWRTSTSRVAASGLPRDINRQHVLFLRELADDHPICGLLGPAGDAYNPDEALSETEAYDYHQWQANELSGADLLMAATLPALTEAKGLARAMGKTGKPYLLSFVITPEASLLDGTPLDQAIEEIDRLDPQPLAYALNCSHPTTCFTGLTNTKRHNRVTWVQANTSALSPAELDGSEELHTCDPEEFASQMVTLRERFGISVLGGCCGTDGSHLEALAAKLSGS